jgi:hypothetical protein
MVRFCKKVWVITSVRVNLYVELLMCLMNPKHKIKREDMALCYPTAQINPLEILNRQENA